MEQGMKLYADRAKVVSLHLLQCLTSFLLGGAERADVIVNFTTSRSKQTYIGRTSVLTQPFSGGGAMPDRRIR